MYIRQRGIERMDLILIISFMSICLVGIVLTFPNAERRCQHPQYKDTQACKDLRMTAQPQSNAASKSS